MSNAKKLTAKQLAELKDRVLADKERILNKMSLAEQSTKLTGTDSGKDEVDSANDEIIRHAELRFATRESLYLKKLVKTLDQMNHDDYGECEECGSNISFMRLKARPTSTMCIGCKEESERDEMRSFHGIRSTSFQKTTGM